VFIVKILRLAKKSFLYNFLRSDILKKKNAAGISIVSKNLQIPFRAGHEGKIFAKIIISKL
jgi:hypothetical protein